MTPKLHIALVVLLTFIITDCARPDVRPALAIIGPTVINVRDGTRMNDAVVLIEEGRIIRVGPVGEVPIPSHSCVLAARGKYVIPGLWDVHTHIQNAREFETFIPL